jgi:hypothetical protein
LSPLASWNAAKSASVIVRDGIGNIAELEVLEPALGEIGVRFMRAIA